ncbi:GNAT family N-acetyltransferase [Roseicyclus sp.]|uniref:GNAT family N-acetyltransferase n=1 Tax=Roseicyclus sp. TaxID=1914329 RepID=UPI003F6AA4CD
MRLCDLMPVIAATWPTAELHQQGPFIVPDGAGGGQRVSAARLCDPLAEDATEAEIDTAIGGLAALGQPPLFMLLDHQGALDARLAARGFNRRDETCAMTVPTADIAAPPPPITCFPIWPPLAIQSEIWATGGIGPARLAVMDRAPLPKASFLGRTQDRPAGTAFVAIHDRIAMLHALEILPVHRRRGLGATMMRAAANWALDQGAGHFSLLVTVENKPALGLYASLGFLPVGQYHYRAKTI